MWLGFRSLFSAEAVYFLRRMGPDVPLVFSYHLDVYRERFLARRLWNAYKLVGKKLVGALTHVITFSQLEADTIPREFHVLRERMSVVPHGVPVIHTHKTRAPGAARVSLRRSPVEAKERASDRRKFGCARAPGKSARCIADDRWRGPRAGTHQPFDSRPGVGSARDAETVFGASRPRS